MNAYKPTIGIEVHAELNTKSKMFCGCPNDPHNSEPNTNICAVCLAHPGTLPTVNHQAIEKVLLVGKAIDGKVADYSEFDRKQYFYPDIPKAYQLSQYAFPFVKGGELSGVAITRIHLEEDTAKSQHDNANTNANGGSLVDFNRAGVPLMELVTEPVIHDAKSAASFTRELQLLLKTLGVSDANMEKGEMRVEANISVSATDELGVKVEVKNLNSFKSMEQAIEYEISRQSEILSKNGSISQETRGWDENYSRTFVQRSKESAMDYRYFPDPDIPKYVISQAEGWSDTELRAKLPELPKDTRIRLINQGLSEDQVEILLGDPSAKAFLEAAYPSETDIKDKSEVKAFANYLLSDVAGLRAGLSNSDLNSAHAIYLRELIAMLSAAEINSRGAKDMLKEVVFDGKKPKELAAEMGLLQNNSAEFVDEIAKGVMSANEQVVAEVRAGKESALQFLVGQGMKASRGRANPAVLMETFKRLIAG